jgi:hypothetical protein
MKKLAFIILINLSLFSQEKINGISFVASNREITSKAIDPIIAINANWVTLMPFAFMKSTTDTTIIYNDKHQWWGERKEGITKTTKDFHDKKIKVMLKPQIWIAKGDFTGHIKMSSEKNWKALEKNYENFILDYAKLAQTLECEMLCIGTELNTFVTNRPVFWNNLILKIRSVYKGKITYAENWDSYKKVPFWSGLDYIGIDAYFPLDPEKTPTIKALGKAWKPIKKEFILLSEKYNKKILFAEFGYQSKEYTAKEPWDHSNQNNVNLKGQENAVAVILASFWNQDWFAGGFLWKWYDNHQEAGGNNDSDYTVQNKPAEKIVKTFYYNTKKNALPK